MKQTRTTEFLENMDKYQKTREAILVLNQEVCGLIGQAAIELGNEEAFRLWEQSCHNITRQLMDHIVKVAVIGAIKSGKSTLVNALLQGDYLKRGAGVVTSIVTRLRQGNHLKARLFFKSWDDINAEIRHSLILFPTDEWRTDKQIFDIRRSQDRYELRTALETLDSEMRVVQDSLNANGVLLSSYVKGYAEVKDYVSAESTTREFDSEHFGDHRSFVGNDALAVYLKDIQLEVPGDFLTRNIEIADCQGSDSPNPLHLTMIQDYLLKAHLLVYVISSRTGVRQADIRFLSIIKRMGIAGNMLFVVNCDLNEHDSLSDLKNLIQRIREDLSLIVAGPDVFAFSALLKLFSSYPSQLAPKDQERLAQWQKAEQLTSFSKNEARRLEDLLDRKLTRERSALLLQNQLARIEVILNNLQQWLRLKCDLLRTDASDAKNMAEKLQSHQQHMLQVQSMVRSTLEGTIQKISKEIKKDIDRFFDLHSGPVLGKVLSFVKEFTIDLDRYQEQLMSSGFTHSLYLVFQEFKQSIDLFMAEKVNPEIIGFIREEEQKIYAQLMLVAKPYEAMVKDALAQYQKAIEQFGISQADAVSQTPINLEASQEVSGLSLPPAAATMNYTAYIKTDAVLRLGFYSLARIMRKMLKKSVSAEKAEEVRALKDGIRKMKRETVRSITLYFKDYKENIKFQYIQKYSEGAGQRLYQILTEQFGAYAGNVQEMLSGILGKREDKERIDSFLENLLQRLTALRARLKPLRQDVHLLLENQTPDIE